jgi:uncharacterized membrane protein YgaE (UPF0421/DUF939 family)
MSILAQIQAQRPTTRATLFESCAYAAQAVIATTLVIGLYRWMGAGSAMWAAVSAVLVLQPRFHHSLAASAIRVIANLLGAGIGVIITLAIPQRILAEAIALTLIVLVCEFGRLDAGVRSACASVLIITMAPGSLIERGIERATAVCIGCAVALTLQLALYGLLLIGKRQNESSPGPSVDSE